MKGEGSDEFRAGMRKAAWKRIDEHPRLGKGYGLDMREVEAIYNEGNIGSTGGKELLAMGGAWHSTVLGIAADFGLTALLFYFTFLVQLGVANFRVFHKAPEGSWCKVFAMMQLLYFFQMVMRCYTSGDSAGWCLNWLNYGMALGMLKSLQSNTPTDSSGPKNV